MKKFFDSSIVNKLYTTSRTTNATAKKPLHSFREGGQHKGRSTLRKPHIRRAIHEIMTISMSDDGGRASNPLNGTISKNQLKKKGRE